MDPRERILRAAAHVFAQTGYRGATTRRIAQAAEVNEVTLFRHFGSKEELIGEAMVFAGRQGDFPTLPAEPRDPREELVEWCTRHMAHLYDVRSLIRTVIGATEEHPEIKRSARDRPMRVRHDLREYLLRLQASGLAARDIDADAAAAMLAGALFSDTMGRDLMPESYPYSMDEAPALYVELFLRAIGAQGEPSASPQPPPER